MGMNSKVWRGILGVILGLIVWPAAAGAQEFASVSATLNQNALRPGEEAVLAVVLEVQPGYHAQSHQPLDKNLIPYDVKLKTTESIETQSPLYPQGHIEEYPDLGRLSVYTGRSITYVPVRVPDDAEPGLVTISGQASFQICDDSMCFPPETLEFEVLTQIVAAGTTVVSVKPELFEEYSQRLRDLESAAPATQPGSQTRAGVGSRVNWSISFAFGAAFIAGLLFNIMPCVLPVLPIKAKGFYEVAHHRRSQAFIYGLVFSLGLISIFVILALIVLVFRFVTWGGLFSNPWFIWFIVGLLVFLSLGLFGSYDANLPTFVYNFQPRHDTYGGNFFWGALMAILATPCTAPLLPALLLWASSQPATIGVPAMIMVGVGMASPYLILSAFPELARGIPRTGPWADLFKQMLGFMMLAAAAYFAGGRLVHGVGFWWIVVAVVAVAAFYLMARTVQLSKSALPVAISSVLAVVMLGGMIWWTARINGLLRPAVAAAGVKASWTPFTDSGFESARASGKPVLVKFTANWCATCQVIEGTVFQDPDVWAALQGRDVVTLKVDLTDGNAQGKQLLLSLNPAGGIPLTAIYAPGAEEPIILESIYTTDTLLGALNTLPPGPSRTAMR